MVFGISITNLMYVNSKSDDLGHLDLSKTSEQQIQERPQQLETSSTTTGPSTPASTPVAQPEHQWRPKDPQVPGKVRGNGPRALQKRQEPLEGTARTHCTGRRKRKNPEHIRQSPSFITRQPPENAYAAPAPPTPESHHHPQIP